jgi:ankyrin repeat protein
MLYRAIVLPILAASGCAEAWCTEIDIFAAIRNDDLTAVRNLRDSDLEKKDRHGSTPLMHAAAFGSVESIEILLKKGADVNAKNAFNATALLRCAGDARKARMLIERGADVKIAAQTGRTPLIVAARQPGNAAIVALMISKGADVQAKDRNGVTALHQATNAGDLESMRLLIENGADVNALDSLGDSPLLKGAGLGSAAVVRLLLSKGARPNVARTVYNKARHGQIALVGLTPLIHAAPYGTTETIAALLAAGADVKARDSRGMTPLMFAVASERQDPGVVKLLLDAGSEVNARSGAGETALDWAMKFGNPATIAMLKKAGAAPGSRVAEAPAPKAVRRTEGEAAARAVALLQQSSSLFFRESGCVGCHHQPATAMAVGHARAAGIAVDDRAAKEQGEMLTKGWGVSAEEMLQGIHRGGGSDRLVNQLLAVHAAGFAADAMTDAALADVALLQHRDGHWFDEYEPRAPMADGVIARTAYAIRAFKVLGWKGRRAEFEERIARAQRFLMAAKAVTGDDRAMRVLGLAWSGAPQREVLAAARELAGRQREDGGWAGNDHLASDAFTTGESLVALRQGGLKGDPAFRRGIEYLLKTQHADGSWHVRSRAVKFQPYFQSGFPFDHDQWISAAATAWAVQALAGEGTAQARVH